MTLMEVGTLSRSISKDFSSDGVFPNGRSIQLNEISYFIDYYCEPRSKNIEDFN